MGILEFKRIPLCGTHYSGVRNCLSLKLILLNSLFSRSVGTIEKAGAGRVGSDRSRSSRARFFDRLH